jgi:hypothetical protein
MSYCYDVSSVAELDVQSCCCRPKFPKSRETKSNSQLSSSSRRGLMMDELVLYINMSTEYVDI